jgi:hypothetical protein
MTDLLWVIVFMVPVPLRGFGLADSEPVWVLGLGIEVFNLCLSHRFIIKMLKRGRIIQKVQKKIPERM